MKHYTIRIGRKAAHHSSVMRQEDTSNQRYDEKNIFTRAALLALCGSIVCVSFLAYSAAPRQQPVVQVMARPGGDGSGNGTVPTISENGDGSLWSYIEGLIRGVIDDAGN